MATPSEIPSVFEQLQVPTGEGVAVHLGSPLEELELDGVGIVCGTEPDAEWSGKVLDLDMSGGMVTIDADVGLPLGVTELVVEFGVVEEVLGVVVEVGTEEEAFGLAVGVGWIVVEVLGVTVEVGRMVEVLGVIVEVESTVGLGVGRMVEVFVLSVVELRVEVEVGRGELEVLPSVAVLVGLPELVELIVLEASILVSPGPGIGELTSGAGLVLVALLDWVVGTSEEVVLHCTRLQKAIRTSKASGRPPISSHSYLAAVM